MADKKVFTIEINGVKQSYDEVVKLRDVLNDIKDVTAKVSVEVDKNAVSNQNSVKASREKAKALTDEEKAQKKLAETQEKAAKPISELEKEQAKANIQLKERAKELQNVAKLEEAAAGSPAAMKAELALVNQELDKLPKGTEEFERLTLQAKALSDELKESEFAKGTFGRNVGNYPQQLGEVNSSFEKLATGIAQTSNSAKGMFNVFQAGVGIALIFDDSNTELEKTLNKLGKIMAIVGALQKANNALLTKGAVISKGAAVMEGIHAIQVKARATAIALSTKNTIAATVAQAAFNVVAKANPYVLLAMALITVVGALALFVTGTNSAKESQDGFNRELERTHRLIEDSRYYYNFSARLAKAEGKSSEEIYKIQKEGAAEEIKLAEEKYNKLKYIYDNSSEENKKRMQEELDHSEKMRKEAYDRDKDIENDEIIRKAQERTDANKKEHDDAEANNKRRLEDQKRAGEQELEYQKQLDEISRQQRLKAIKDDEAREVMALKQQYEKELDVIKGSSEKEETIRQEIEDNMSAEIANIRQKYQEAEKKALEDEAKEKEAALKDHLDKELKLIQNNTGKQLLVITKDLEEGNITREEYNIKRLELLKKTLEAEKKLRESYGEDTTEIDTEISETTIDIADATSKTVINKWESIHDKLQKYSDQVMTGVNAIFDATNSVLQAQLDDANAKFDAISEKYDQVVEKREESDSRLQELEEQAKNARGGRALILQEQINAEMQANQELANQEKQLAKEKEKQEAEIAKKEKQMKRVEIAQNIAQAITQTSLGVMKAYAASPLTLGLPWSAIIAATGAIQVGVMTAQLAKLEDGGLLKGKRHSQGGMRIEGTNIEVEGGEYVINRESTDKNIGLVKYINSQRRTLGYNDLSSFFTKTAQGFEPPFKKMFETGGQLPAVENNLDLDKEIIDAIQKIKFEPRVAVTDINQAQDDAVRVDNWAGL